MSKSLSISKKKAAKAAKKGADFTTKNALPIIKAAGIITAMWAGYKAITGIASLIKGFGSDPTAGGGNPDFDGTKIPDGATINPNLAQTKAAAIFNAMRYPGTDVTKIINSLTGMNSIDYALISQAFGKPKYAAPLGTHLPYGVWPALNITEWLHSELDENDLNRLRQVMPGVI